MALDFLSDPSVGDLQTFGNTQKAANQLELAKNPQRFRFQIIYGGGP